MDQSWKRSNGEDHEKYQKSNGIATIYFGTNFEYIYKEYNKIDKKIQDRAKVEYIYVYDTSLVSDNKKTLGVNCPNCGSTNIRRLRRVTGYLTGDYKTAFNPGKIDEVEHRVKHKLES